MSYFFTSESYQKDIPIRLLIRSGDALIDQFLAFASELQGWKRWWWQVILAGEVKSNAYLDVQTIAIDVISRIGSSEYMFDAVFCTV